MLLTSPAIGALIDFTGINELPADLPGGRQVSQLGTVPDGVLFDGPLQSEDSTVLPHLPSTFLSIEYVSADSTTRLGVDSDYGYRLFLSPHDPVDLEIALQTRTDDQLISLESDGTFRVVKNHADFVGDGTNSVSTIRGLRDENGSINLPIFHVLELEGATYVNWRLEKFHALSQPISFNAGVAFDVVPEAKPTDCMLAAAATLFVWTVAGGRRRYSPSPA